MPRAKSADGAEGVGPRLVPKSVRLKSAPPAVVTHEQIALRAYEIFLREGGGDDVGHWLRAEQELLQSQTAAPVRKTAGTRTKA